MQCSVPSSPLSLSSAPGHILKTPHSIRGVTQNTSEMPSSQDPQHQHCTVTGYKKCRSAAVSAGQRLMQCSAVQTSRPSQPGHDSQVFLQSAQLDLSHSLPRLLSCAACHWTVIQLVAGGSIQANLCINLINETDINDHPELHTIEKRQKSMAEAKQNLLY